MTATTQRPDDLDMRSMLPAKAALHDMIGGWLAEDIGRLDITTEFLIPAEVMSKVEGRPFKVEEIRARIDSTLSGGNA